MDLNTGTASMQVDPHLSYQKRKMKKKWDGTGAVDFG